jgi:signal transduction histidine kinase
MKKIWENLKVFMKREWWIALLTTLFMVSTVVAVASINGKYGSPDDREAATYYYIPESGGYDGDSLFANRYLTTYADAIKKITISPKDVTDEQVQTFINGLPSLADRLSAIDDRYKYQDMYNDRTMTKKEYDSLIDQQVALDKSSQDQKAIVVRKLLADEATRSIRQIAQDRLDDNDAQYLDTNYSYYLSGEFGAITDIAQLKIQKKPTAIEAKVDGASETRVYDVKATYRLTDYNAANEIFYGVDDTIDSNGVVGALINEKTTFDVTGYVGLNGQLAQSFNTETTNYKRLVSIMVPALTIAILSFLALTIILFARPLVAEEIELLEVLPIDIRFVLGVIFTIFAAIDAFWLAKIIVSFGSYLPVSLIVIGLVAIAGLLAGFILYTLLRNLWGIIRRAPGHTRFMGQVKNSIIARFGKWAYGLIKKIPAKYFFVQMAIEMIAVALVGFVLLIPVYSHFLQFLIIVGVLVAWGFIIKKHLSQITGIISSVDHLLKSNKIDTAGAVSVTDTLEKVGQIDSFVQDTKARDAQAQALKTELITNVSHDLRSPLTSIITYGDLLAQDDLSEEDRKDYVAVVNQKAARMKQLIDDLFEVVKMDNGEVALQTSSLDFVAFVKQVVSENSDLFDHAKLSLVSKYPDNEIAMSIDAGQMQRVVINLLENASKYSLDGTRVFLKLEEINHQVLLEIKNTSKHPLDEDADTLLERFKRGDSSRNSEGSGLGLAIVDSIVRLHKGSFQVAIDGDVFIARVILNQ